MFIYHGVMTFNRQNFSDMLKHYSDKYDVDSLSAEERNMIYLPEIEMTWSATWSALRKSWKLLKVGP
jgi:hypothetical protein